MASKGKEVMSRWWWWRPMDTFWLSSAMLSLSLSLFWCVKHTVSKKKKKTEIIRRATLHQLKVRIYITLYEHQGQEEEISKALFSQPTSFSAASSSVSIFTFADLVFFPGAGGKVAVCAHRYSGDFDKGHWTLTHNNTQYTTQKRLKCDQLQRILVTAWWRLTQNTVLRWIWGMQTFAKQKWPSLLTLLFNNTDAKYWKRENVFDQTKTNFQGVCLSFSAGR